MNPHSYFLALKAAIKAQVDDRAYRWMGGGADKSFDAYRESVGMITGLKTAFYCAVEVYEASTGLKLEKHEKEL